MDVIFGCNGLVWVGAHVEPPKEADVAAAAADPEAAAEAKPEVGTVPADVRTHVARVANVVRVLSRLFLPIHLPAVLSLATVSSREYYGPRQTWNPRAFFASTHVERTGKGWLSTTLSRMPSLFSFACSSLFTR